MNGSVVTSKGYPNFSDMRHGCKAAIAGRTRDVPF